MKKCPGKAHRTGLPEDALPDEEVAAEGDAGTEEDVANENEEANSGLSFFLECFI